MMTLYQSFLEGYRKADEPDLTEFAGRFTGKAVKKVLEGILLTVGVLIALKINGCVSNDSYRVIHEQRPAQLSVEKDYRR